MKRHSNLDKPVCSKLPMNHFGSPMSMKTSYFHRRQAGL